MIGLDTNILLRYLLEDDLVQSAKAEHLIDVGLSQSDPGYISLVTMAETAWVLGSIYRFNNREIVSAISEVLDTKVFVIQNRAEVYTALTALQAGKADFADALIAAIGLWANCTTTLTFDKKASRLSGFTLL